MSSDPLASRQASRSPSAAFGSDAPTSTYLPSYVGELALSITILAEEKRVRVVEALRAIVELAKNDRVASRERYRARKHRVAVVSRPRTRGRETLENRPLRSDVRSAASPENKKCDVRVRLAFGISRDFVVPADLRMVLHRLDLPRCARCRVGPLVHDRSHHERSRSRRLPLPELAPTEPTEVGRREQPTKKRRKPTHYKVMCISMYTRDIADLEAKVTELKRRGWTKANKSQVLRMALSRLDLDDLIPIE